MNQNHATKPIRKVDLLAALLGVLCVNLTRAQDRTVTFGTGATGVNTIITNSGLDRAEFNYDAVQRTLIFVGTTR